MASDLGGGRAQAVEVQVEGVKGGEKIEIAEGEIEIVSEPLVSWTKRHRVLSAAMICGVVALGEVVKIGFKALGISANAQLTEDGRARAGDRRRGLGRRRSRSP